MLKNLVSELLRLQIREKFIFIKIFFSQKTFVAFLMNKFTERNFFTKKGYM
jgi:hypothetical protein